MADERGRFVWYDLSTTDPAGAKAFYGKVVGWGTQEWEPLSYTMWTANGTPIGGIMPPAPANAKIPPHWLAHITVPDVDATVKQATSLGGRILSPAADIPGVGRYAVLSDPQGAAFAVFAPSAEMPRNDEPAVGEFSWHELATSDWASAFTFYQALFGWDKQAEHDMGPMGKYLLWGRGGKQLGGMMTTPPGMKTPDGRDVPPSWMFYVTTDDLDAALGRAKARGARVLNGPMEVPGGQRIVQLMDPQGAAFALVTAPAS
jgi:predicted enzyme related to lactoylglutathione lyase